jgi:hypothetical protein
MSRFPNLTEQEKDRLLRLFLTSGSLRITSGKEYAFEVFEHSLNELDEYYGKLILKAMNDLYSPV